MTNSFSKTIWYSLQESATTLGVRLTAVLGGTIDHPRVPTPARKVYDLLDVRNFDGVLLHTAALSYYSNDQAVGGFLAELAGLPVVSFGVALDGVTSVGVRQAEAVKELVRHLSEAHGFRRFAFVAGPATQIEAQIRKAAFFEAIEEWGIGSDRVEVFPGEYNRESGAQAVRVLAARGGAPVALVCSNDDEAIGALEAARALGVAVPGQLAVVGFDDIDLASLQEPSLTSVGQPLIRQAGRALALLVARVRGGPVVHEFDPAPLYFRESCGCKPKPTVPASDKPGLIRDLMARQTNATDGYLTFLRNWISDYLTAFEYLLETGNPTVLKTQWTQYYLHTAGDRERGISFRQLLVGLEALFGHHPGYQKATQENLMMAGAAESRKGSRVDQTTRTFFFILHGVETLIGQINDREGLASLPFSSLSPLGLSGVLLVRFGVLPQVLYFHSRWTEDTGLPLGDFVDYPALLPAELESLDLPSHRIVVALTTENAYLGYAVFWTESPESFVCDFLANQFSGALQRIELLERVRDQRHSLEASLDETRRMQKQLVETEKVASLGRLVAGVAHEINTPLGTGITGTSFLLDRLGEVQNQFENGSLARSGLQLFFSQGHEALDGVLRNLMKAGELIQAFKGLGLDHGQGEWKPIQLNTLFGDLAAVYSGELKNRGIELKFEVPLVGPLVYSQPSALVQVVGELLENAMDHAFPAGFPGAPQVLLQVSVQADILRLAVTDNGRGLDVEERRHIFDPLYTTRRPEGHAGLGLHLAFQLITRTLNGQMTVASEPGAGSCFLCLIPLKTS